MQSGIYVALSSQMALERRLTTIADNMANVNTTGFRGTEVKFNQVLSNTENKLNAKVAFVSQGNDYLSTDNGELQNTGNLFDFAVKGDAWFGVNTPAGLVLTRDGRFTMSESGALVSTRGYPVLDPGGAPIQLDPGGGAPSVSADGTIAQNGKPVGKIGLYSSDISKGFLRYDNSGVLPTDTPQSVVDRSNVGIAQGYLENSNVNGMREMTQLIEVSRAFDNISTLTNSSEGTLSDAIKTLGGSQ
ncbi:MULTISPECIES: flagellar basal-body rod protein FlgF [Rhizobium]|uniref:Flagellar basal-body rod protein FlgF n=1 Tax=Rhizobium paranaense TaxID=1650438 RepID=A0A7W9CYY5_9HYPH|nr:MULTISPECIES: flagellar basal-body rod protein FlgF [Rhizobium]MBB5571445.1 flagellar basal-body rod protein FlgF [Rhizobium paranaense]PST64580.1 flagellar basal-body rod protein FlgF [Rhizobium sp. SEMIA4064]